MHDAAGRRGGHSWRARRGTVQGRRAKQLEAVLRCHASAWAGAAEAHLGAPMDRLSAWLMSAKCQNQGARSPRCKSTASERTARASRSAEQRRVVREVRTCKSTKRSFDRSCYITRRRPVRMLEDPERAAKRGRTAGGGGGRSENRGCADYEREFRSQQQASWPCCTSLRRAGATGGERSQPQAASSPSVPDRRPHRNHVCE